MCYYAVMCVYAETQDVSVQEMHIKVKWCTYMKQILVGISLWECLFHWPCFTIWSCWISWCPVSLSRWIHGWHAHFMSQKSTSPITPQMVSNPERCYKVCVLAQAQEPNFFVKVMQEQLIKNLLNLSINVIYCIWLNHEQETRCSSFSAH